MTNIITIVLNESISHKVLVGEYREGGLKLIDVLIKKKAVRIKCVQNTCMVSQSMDGRVFSDSIYVE